MAAYGQADIKLLRHSDSLYRNLKRIEDREKRAIALFDLGFFWGDHDSTIALKYISEAENLLGKKSYTHYYRGLVAFYTASAHFGKAPDKAKKLYMEGERSLKVADRVHETQAAGYRARLWGSYGALLQREGKASEYVEILLKKVIPLAERSGDPALMGNNYQNLAINLMNQKEYARADSYYRKAIDLLRLKENTTEERLTLYVNAGRNALLAENYNQTEKLLDTAAVLARTIPHSLYVPMYHTVAGSYHAARGNFARSHRHLAEGLASAEKLKNEELISAVLYDQFVAYQLNGQYSKAKAKLLEVQPYIDRKSSLANKKMLYYDLAKTTVSLNQYQEAVRWYEAHKVLADSMFSNRNRAEIMELENRFRAAEKERELLSINAQHQKQSLELQKNRIIAIISVSLCLLLSISGFAWYRAQRNRKRLSEQKELLLQEEIRNHLHESRLNVYNAMLQGEEKERGRLARDLHDGLGGMLASVKMKLSTVTEAMDGDEEGYSALEDLRSIIVQLDSSAHELRRVSRNLMPDSLLNRGLEDALRDLCKGMSQPHLQIDYQSSGLIETYGQPFLVSVYRIVQELLNNAVKHSEADQVWVQCSQDCGNLYLSVEDNGKGFDPTIVNTGQQSASLRGMGLANIVNRTAFLNGQLEIDTSPGKGTSIHVQIAMEESPQYQ